MTHSRLISMFDLDDEIDLEFFLDFLLILPPATLNEFYFRWLKYKITEIGMSHQNLDEPSKMKPPLLSETDNLSGSD